jgi:protein-S-isoprenylcysteine O-methyltransferase Ste14
MDFDSCLREAAPAIRAVDDLNAQMAIVQLPDWQSAVIADPDNAAVLAPWRCMARRFTRLDALAGIKKRRQLLGAKVIPLLAALGIVAFQWYGSIGLDRYRPHAWISLVAYVLLVFSAVLVWLAMTKRHRVEWTFVHARALAEAMRVQLAWTGSGVPGNAPDLYLARRSSDVRQLRVLLRAAVLESGIVVALGGTSGSVSRGADWIKEQVDYFSPQSRGMQRRSSHLSAWDSVIKALKVLVIVLSALLLVDSIPGILDSGPLAGQESLFCFVVACALAVTVGVSYWQHVTLDREDLEVAARMRNVYGNAGRAMQDGAVDPRQVLRALGKEALDEQAEWFANHRERLRMPDVG